MVLVFSSAVCAWEVFAKSGAGSLKPSQGNRFLAILLLSQRASEAVVFKRGHSMYRDPGGFLGLFPPCSKIVYA